MADRQEVFVAYSSRDPAVAAIVFDAARLANALPLPVIDQPWQFNDVAGNPLEGLFRSVRFDQHLVCDRLSGKGDGEK